MAKPREIAPVAAVDAPAADEAPDHTYADGQVLPGGPPAFRTPGPDWPHHSFISPAYSRILCCSDS